MNRRLVGALILLLMLAAIAAPAAYAQGFARVGPVAFGGYPAWYQDKTGLGMEFCSPLNASELAGGWCLLLTGDTVAPEVFPGQFFDEHFYWAASADASVGGTKALLVLGLEGAFAVGSVVQGDQIVFGRLRIVINPVPASGTYTVYTPFGKYVFPDQVAGGKLFFTEDIGIQCAPGDFTCALASKIGPFLLPSATAGGAEMPPVTQANQAPDTNPAHFGGVFAATTYPGTGKSYIADPARIGPVTGSPLPDYLVGDNTLRNPNIFRIEGPTGDVLSETTNFSLMGRVFEGATVGRVTVDRATYSHLAAGNKHKLSVFATGFPTSQGRLPAGLQPAAITPILQYYEAPCIATLDANGNLLSYGVPNVPAVQIVGFGTHYFGQSEPLTLPFTQVCVIQTNARDANGNAFTAFFPTVVGDEVSITEALYDLGSQTLTIQASSSDVADPPTLTAVDFGDLINGSLTVSGLSTPPARVHVTSSARGANVFNVRTSTGSSGAGTTVPTAVNDAFLVQEDTLGNILAIVDNDTSGGLPIPAGFTVILTALPQKGQAQVNADGTVSYTPNPNVNGADSFAYTVTTSGIVSNQASVTVSIAPVNDAPVAFNETLNAFAGLTAALPVLANDTDVDGQADITAVANVSAVTTISGTGTATAGASGKLVNFTATAAGTYTFTYKAQDLGGALSNTATATVVVAAAETITVTLADFRSNSSGRLRFTGTITPVTNPPQRLEIRWNNGSNTVSIVATPVADALGNWLVDIRPAQGIQDPRNSGATQYKVTGPNSSKTGTMTIR
jgi:hypothetical protein